MPESIKSEIIRIINRRSVIYEDLEYIKAGDTYPFPWWHDSLCIAGWGLSAVEPLRAMNIIRFMLRYGLWSSTYARERGIEGFPAHIIFTSEDARYYPDGKIWKTEKLTDHFKTSGITQLPFQGSSVRTIYERACAAGIKEEAYDFLSEIYPSLGKSLEALKNCRDPGDEWLLSIFCPWEDGMDNSPRHDEVMEGITPELIRSLAPHIEDEVRRMRVDNRDREGRIDPVKAKERPTDLFYCRMRFLIEHMREAGYAQDIIYEKSYYNVKNVAFNSVYARSIKDMAFLAGEMAEWDKKNSRRYGDDRMQWESWYSNIRNAMNRHLWDEAQGMYYDLSVGRTEVGRGSLSVEEAIEGNRIITRDTVASFFPMWAQIPDSEMTEGLVENLTDRERFYPERYALIPTLSMKDDDFDPHNYWRGPAWIVTNWIVGRGLSLCGYGSLSQQVLNSLIDIVRDRKIAEHYHPITGERGGNVDFPWSAALVMDILTDRED